MFACFYERTQQVISGKRGHHTVVLIGDILHFGTKQQIEQVKMTFHSSYFDDRKIVFGSMFCCLDVSDCVF